MLPSPVDCLGRPVRRATYSVIIRRLISLQTVLALVGRRGQLGF